MFCENCGREIPDELANGDSLCAECRQACSIQPEPRFTVPKVDNSLAILSFIFAFIFPIVGFILALLAGKKAEYSTSGMHLITAATFISTFALVLGVIGIFWGLNALFALI